MRLRFIPSTLALAFCLGGGLMAGCSVLIEVDRQQCQTNADCARLGPAFADSICESNVCVTPAPSSNGGEGSGGEGNPPIDPLMCAPREPSTEKLVKYSFAPIFALEPAEPKPFTVKACGQLDLECEKPLDGPVEVNPGEPHDFMVPQGFTGFFVVTNPDTLNGLVFMGRPVIQDTVGWNVTMPSPEVVAQLAFATQKTVDPELGLVLTVARDCNGGPLADVTVENSEGGLGYYFVTSLPSTTLTKTSIQGAAGFANVPIGTTILSGVHDSGTKLGPSSVRLKAGYISLVEIWP
jgi:hypothetical protein